MLFLLPTFSIVFAEEADSGREPRNEISSTLFRLRETLVSRAEIQPTRSRFLRGGRGKGIDGRRATNFNERSVRVIKIRISRVGEKSIAEHRRVTSEISLVTCRGRWLASLGHAR